MKKNKELIKFFALGVISCFILKNGISISNGSNGGNADYIISNPSIDEELWYILGVIYLLTIKVFFKRFFVKVTAELRQYEKIALVLDKYALLRQTKLFRGIVILSFFLLGLMVIICALACVGSDAFIMKVNLGLFAYFAFVFNRNYKVIDARYIFK